RANAGDGRERSHTSALPISTVCGIQGKRRLEGRGELGLQSAGSVGPGEVNLDRWLQPIAARSGAAAPSLRQSFGPVVGSGRHTVLKTRRREACWFDSGRARQFLKT